MNVYTVNVMNAHLISSANQLQFKQQFKADQVFTWIFLITNKFNKPEE